MYVRCFRHLVFPVSGFLILLVLLWNSCVDMRLNSSSFATGSSIVVHKMISALS